MTGGVIAAGLIGFALGGLIVALLLSTQVAEAREALEAKDDVLFTKDQKIARMDTENFTKDQKIARMDTENWAMKKKLKDLEPKPPVVSPEELRKIKEELQDLMDGEHDDFNQDDEEEAQAD
jgi:hypothetical protein